MLQTFSVEFVFCTKFASNICYSHWDQRTYASDLHLMTSRELTSGFDFGQCSSPHGRGASTIIIWYKISFSSPKLLTFFRNSRWQPPPSWIFSLCEFGHSRVLIVWYVCSVPNLVQISVSHWDRRTYASDLHLITSRELTSGFEFWSRGYLRMAVVHLPM